MNGSKYRRAACGAVAALGLLAAACGGGDDSQQESGGTADPDAKVKITVADLPPKDQKESRQRFLEQVDEFEAANPNITVEPVETRWEAETFNAMLAGGTMPTVMAIPYTEPRGLIARGQAADITEEFETIGTFANLNQQFLANVQDDQGRVYGVPIGAYSVALIYNRELFEKAGLDPDDPPETWDEVREAARAITTATGEPGYVQMTTENTGGWMLSAMTYSFGGSIQEPAGDGYKASLNNRPAKEALDLLRTLRWEDEVMGDNFLMNKEDVLKEFAAGRVGMYTDGADAYIPLTTTFGTDIANIGVAPLPQQGGQHGTLGGGTVQIVRPDATPEERLAALKWVEFANLNHWFDETAAVEKAKADAADGLPVGNPEQLIVDREQYQKYLGWIEKYINVPLDNFDFYLSEVDTLPVIPEPPAMGQETYAALDPVVQGILTRNDADIDQLMTDSEAKIDNLIAGQ